MNPEVELSEVGLDPEWVAARVGEHFGATATAEMAGFIGTGQMSRNARFNLDWTAGTGPATVVVKVPSGDPGTRAISFEHNVYERECAFYAGVAPIVDIATPDVIHVHVDRTASDFCLILEDLNQSIQGDQFREATDDELRLAITQAAALQAPVWGRTDEPVFEPFRDDDDERASRGAEMMPFLEAVVMERLADRLDPDIPEFLSRFTASHEAWSLARSAPQTLVHGDFRPDNFMLGADPSAPPIAVVDWQTVAVGLGVGDVAYLLAGSLSVERRRAVEDEMIDFYRAELASRGVDYDADECRRHYVLQTLHGVGVGVTATALAERTERGDALFAQMINRHGRHALDFNALDLF